jgi:hypothetical protein
MTRGRRAPCRGKRQGDATSCCSQQSCSALLVAYPRAVRARWPRCYCANAARYRTFKPQLVELVGWGRWGGPDELRTCAAYERLYDLLPTCWSCGYVDLLVAAPRGGVR